MYVFKGIYMLDCSKKKKTPFGNIRAEDGGISGSCHAKLNSCRDSNNLDEPIPDVIARP